MNESLTSSKDSDDLSTGFHQQITTLEHKIFPEKTKKEICYIRIYMKDVFDFAEHQEKASNV